MEVSDFIWLSIAAALTAYLVFRHLQRERQLPPGPQWTGHGIDVAGIADRVRRVRSNIAAELQSRPHDARQRRDLLASARRVVGRLAFFRGRPRRVRNIHRMTQSPTPPDHGT